MPLGRAAHAGGAWKLEMGRGWRCAHGELWEIRCPRALWDVPLMLSVHYPLVRRIGNRRDVPLERTNGR